MARVRLRVRARARAKARAKVRALGLGLGLGPGPGPGPGLRAKHHLGGGSALPRIVTPHRTAALARVISVAASVSIAISCRRRSCRSASLWAGQGKGQDHGSERGKRAMHRAWDRTTLAAWAGPQPWQAGAGAPRFVPSTEMFGLPPALTYHPADRGGRLRGARVADDSFHRPLVRRPGWRLVPACGNKEVDARRPVDGQAGLEGAGWMHCTGRTLKLVMIRELAALAQIHPTRSRALGRVRHVRASSGGQKRL